MLWFATVGKKYTQYEFIEQYVFEAIGEREVKSRPCCIMLAVQLIICSNQITLRQTYLLHPMFVFSPALHLSLSIAGTGPTDLNFEMYASFSEFVS